MAGAPSAGGIYAVYSPLLDSLCPSGHFTTSLLWTGYLSVFLARECCCCCFCVKSFNHVQLFATPWTVAHQAPLSMGFPRQEYWSGLPCPSPGESSRPRDLSWVSCLAGNSLLGKPQVINYMLSLLKIISISNTVFHFYNELVI